jgi:hypothetical protein
MGDMEAKLRQGDPVSNNVHNLVQTLSVKLDSVARYKLYIEDAHSEGEQECADLFRRLEEQDRRAVDELRQHLSSRHRHEPRRGRGAEPRRLTSGKDERSAKGGGAVPRRPSRPTRRSAWSAGSHPQCRPRACQIAFTSSLKRPHSVAGQISVWAWPKDRTIAETFIAASRSGALKTST